MLLLCSVTVSSSIQYKQIPSIQQKFRGMFLNAGVEKLDYIILHRALARNYRFLLAVNAINYTGTLNKHSLAFKSNCFNNNIV